MKKLFLNSFKGYFRISRRLFLYQILIELDKRGVAFSEKFTDKIIDKRDDCVLTYLKNDMKDEIDSFRQNVTPNSDSTDIPKQIWILWWQGEKHAPSLVKICINSMRKNNPSWKVTVLSENNYKEYIDIDPEVMRKYREGKIRIQHLSDLIRFELLYRYGGLWVDGTLLSVKPIPDEILHYDYYTAKGIEVGSNLKYWIDIDLWESYFFACKKNNKSALWILINLRKYLYENRVFPDYLLINYFAKIGREEIPVLQQEFTRIPENNFYIETGKGYLMLNDFSVIDDSDTFVIKLNHRKAELYPQVLRYLKSED